MMKKIIFNLILCLLLVVKNTVASNLNTKKNHINMIPPLNTKNLNTNLTRENNNLNTGRIVQDVFNENVTADNPFFRWALNKPILSLDGGGIRGRVSVGIVKKFEELVSERVGFKVKAGQLFDLIAGTSTGAISALVLTRPLEKGSTVPMWSASDMYDLYKSEGKTIFSQSFKQYVASGNGLFSVKYSDEGVNKLLQRFLGDSRVCDSVTNVVVTAYELVKKDGSSGPALIRSYELKGVPASEMLAWQAGAASGAAPTFFYPEIVIVKDPITGEMKIRAFIDGGMTGMNNPDVLAFSEATSLVRQHENRYKIPNYQKTDISEIYSMSVSTGNYDLHFDVNSFTGGAPLMVPNIIEAFFSAAAMTNALMLSNHAEATGDNNYCRIDPRLPHYVPLDDTSPSGFQAMDQAVNEWIDSNPLKLSYIKDRLTCYFLMKNPLINVKLHDKLFAQNIRDYLAVLGRRKIQLVASAKTTDERIIGCQEVASKQTLLNMMDILKQVSDGQISAMETLAVQGIIDLDQNRLAAGGTPRNVVQELYSNSLASLKISKEDQEQFNTVHSQLQGTTLQQAKSLASGSLSSTISTPNLPFTSLGSNRIAQIQQTEGINVGYKSPRNSARSSSLLRNQNQDLDTTPNVMDIMKQVSDGQISAIEKLAISGNSELDQQQLASGSTPRNTMLKSCSNPLVSLKISKEVQEQFQAVHSQIKETKYQQAKNLVSGGLISTISTPNLHFASLNSNRVAQIQQTGGINTGNKSPKNSPRLLTPRRFQNQDADTIKRVSIDENSSDVLNYTLSSALVYDAADVAISLANDLSSSPTLNSPMDNYYTSLASGSHDATLASSSYDSANNTIVSSACNTVVQPSHDLKNLFNSSSLVKRYNPGVMTRADSTSSLPHTVLNNNFAAELIANNVSLMTFKGHNVSQSEIAENLELSHKPGTPRILLKPIRDSNGEID